MIKKFNCFHSNVKIIFVRLYSSIHFDDYNTKCIITIIIRLIFFEYFCLFSCKTIQFHRHKYTLLSVNFSRMLKIFISLPQTFTFLILLFFLSNISFSQTLEFVYIKCLSIAIIVSNLLSLTALFIFKYLFNGAISS